VKFTFSKLPGDPKKCSGAWMQREMTLAACTQAEISMDIFDSRLLTILSSPQIKLAEMPVVLNLLS